MENKYMYRAVELARECVSDSEVPVGAVIVKDDKIIAEGRNRREKSKNVLCHAEIEAINNACLTLGRWRLDDCDIYVTMEPCPMCAGAIINARLRRVYFGAFDKKAGSFGSTADFNRIGYNHKPELYCGIMENECGALLADFFKQLRKNKQKINNKY